MRISRGAQIIARARRARRIVDERRAAAAAAEPMVLSPPPKAQLARRVDLDEASPAEERAPYAWLMCGNDADADDAAWFACGCGNGDAYSPPEYDPFQRYAQDMRAELAEHRQTPSPSSVTVIYEVQYLD